MEGEEGGVDPLGVLTGTGLRAYLALLKAGRPVGVRELQRMLGLSSPSTARHHLERLVQLGLAVREPEGYRALPPRRGLLRLYVVVRGRLLPRIAGLAAFTATAAIAYALLPGSDPAATTVMAVAAALTALEAARMYRAVRELEEGG